MHVLVVGSNGQLGQELARSFKTGVLEIGPIPAAFQDANVDYVDIDQIDITDEASVDAWFSSHAPYDVIINCAAYTNVDGCEAHEDDALKVNATGPKLLAQMAAKQDAVFVHVSTDYVFSGQDAGERTEEDATNPLSAYGRTKHAGEQAALVANPKTHVVRTAWLYGYVGKNFVKTMRMLAESKDNIQVVSDQLGNPTSANDLAYALLQIALMDDYGIWHATNEGTCSWAEFASAIMQGLHLPCEVEHISSAKYQELNPKSADRPAFSSLKNGKLEKHQANRMRPWREALATYLANLSEQDDRRLV